MLIIDFAVLAEVVVGAEEAAVSNAHDGVFLAERAPDVEVHCLK